MTRFLDKILSSPFKVYCTFLGVTFLIFSRSLFFGFSPIDENWLISGNTEFLSDWANLLHSFNKNIQNSYYRPLLIDTFIINYKLSGLDPFIYHLTNILLHAFSVILLFKLLGRLKIEAKISFLLCLLFAVHPLAVHAVAWIPGRNDSLICIFTLLSCLNLLNYLELKRGRHLVFFALFFLCALLTKESALSLPLVYLFIFLLAPRTKSTWLLTFISSLAAIGIWYFLRHRLLQGFPAESRNFWPAFADFSLALLVYTGKALLPFRQSVSPVLGNSLIWVNALVVLALVFLCFKQGFQNKKIAVLGIVMFYSTLALSAWFGAQTRSGVHYEHRAYASLIGLVMFLSQLKLNYQSWLIKTALGLFLLLFSAKTLYRQSFYQNELSYLEEGLLDCPDNHFFHYQKGLLLYQEGKYAEALPSMNRAIELWPNQVNLYNNRGNAHFKLKHKKETINDYTKALQLSNYKTSIYLSRCAAYKEFGEIDKAKEDMEAIKSKSPEALPRELEVEINKLWLAHGLEKATTLIEKYPNNAKLYIERAQIYFYLRKGPEALADLKKATELEPGNKQYKAYYEKLNSTYPHK